LDERGESHECRGRHAAWFTQLAERAWRPLTGGDEQPWLETLETEYDNLVSAFQWSLANGKDELALRLAAALVPFWHRKGYFNEGRSRLQRVLEAAGGDCLALRARALGGLGLLAMMQGDLSGAATALEESLSLSRAEGHTRAIASALRLLGFVAVFAQDARSALPLLEQSVTMARAEDDVHSLVDALALYGRAQLFLAEIDGARRAFEECRRLGEEAGEGGGDALIGLGWTALAEGDHRGAATAFEQALDVVRRAGDPFLTALTLSFLGELAWARGDLGPARAWLEEGLSLARAVDAPFPLSRCLLGLGRVMLAEGDDEAAESNLDEAVTVAREAQLPWALVRCLQGRAEAGTARGDQVGARRSLEESLTLAQAKGDKAGIAASLHRLGRLARGEHDEQSAGRLQLEALALFATVGDLAGVADTLEALAGLAAGTGRCAHAARLFGAAESLRLGGGAPRAPQLGPGYQADCSLVRSALEASELDEAWAQGAALSRDEAVALASRGRGGRARPPSGWASLTPTERRVVELAAEGFTNREISERLFVSPRTVQAHLLRVFPKLGISSRRQLRDVRDADRGGLAEAVADGRNTRN
jgi:DNA-binding CsgD family transcriptional regulator